jgi:hypothetical protein
MARYRGDVEQARRELRSMGYTQSRARELAPRIAEQQQRQQDQQAPPFSWAVGGPGITSREDD